ncbi:MAG: DUF2958 domain-containing protein [Rhodospirillaceae bacterium]
MKLLTQEILARLPPLYATEEVAIEEKVAQVKYFSAWSAWSWYGIEYNPTDRIFFGLVVGFETEFGNFSLDELVSVRGPGGLRIERDLYFRPTRLGDLPEFPAMIRG